MWTVFPTWFLSGLCTFVYGLKGRNAVLEHTAMNHKP